MLTIEKAREVLSHQLNGIMLHNDFFAMYTLYRMEDMAKLHERQVIEETKAYLKTSAKLTCLLNEKIDVPQVARQTLPSTQVKASSRMARMDAHGKALDEWEAWEQATHDMYMQLKEENPECKLWGCLEGAARQELWKIDKLQDRFWEGWGG